MKRSRSNLKFNYGGFWIRFLAYAIDVILLSITSFLLLGVLILFLGFSGVIAYPILTPLLGVVYFTYFVGTKGATPGKILFRLRIVDVGGSKITFGKAFLRYLCYFISSLPLGLGFFWIAWDKKKQGFHDKIVGTYVIKTGGKQNE